MLVEIEVVVVLDVGVVEGVVVVVGVDVGEVLGLVDAEVVGEVDGVVLSQLPNPPARNSSVMSFNVWAAAAQSLESIKYRLKTHPKSSSLAPVPRHSRMA